MSIRNIYVTSQDRQRLAVVIQQSGERDRGDLLNLVDELNRATVVTPEEVPPDVIAMNSRVRLHDLDEGTSLEYTLVYPDAASFSDGKISVLAPIGTALLGYRVGDEIEWQVPAGARRLRIEEMLYQPEAAGDYQL